MHHGALQPRTTHRATGRQGGNYAKNSLLQSRMKPSSSRSSSSNM